MDPAANRTYDFIDGLRGLAILMVVAGHAIYAKEQHHFVGRFLLGFIGTGGKGVGLFFTLSGFLISWPFWKRKVSGAASLIPSGYGWRRFWKIYPPLALSVLLLTPCYILLVGDAAVFLRAAFQWLTGLAFLLPVSGKLNPVMWSLVVEIHFYLILPLLFLATKRIPPKACVWGLSLFLLVGPLTIQAVTGVMPMFAPEIKDPFLTGLSCFSFGVFFAGIDNLKAWNRRWTRIADAGWGVMLVSLLGMVWVSFSPGTHGVVVPRLVDWTFMFGAGCLLCYAAAPENPRAQLLCTPWLRWCGIISYEWYLFHQPLLIWTRHWFGPAQGNVFKYALILGLPLGIGVGFSALVYRKFSLPILQFGRSRNRSLEPGARPTKSL